jgi:hypothetical protein
VDWGLQVISVALAIISFAAVIGMLTALLVAIRLADRLGLAQRRIERLQTKSELAARMSRDMAEWAAANRTDGRPRSIRVLKGGGSRSNR